MMARNSDLDNRYLLNTPISTGSYATFVKHILFLGERSISSYICVMNVHMLIEARNDIGFKNVIKNADIVTPDGMPLAKGLELLYGTPQDRVAGMDLLPDLLSAAEKAGLKVYFYGGTPEMQKRTEEYVQRTYPLLKTTGFHSPPFRPLTVEEEEKVVNMINNSETNLVFVALGCPKQEKWMAGMKGRIHACMVGIGGALPVMIGLQERAPVWMQKYSLEWLYRLYQEPERLWKRYFYTNSLFLALFVREYVKVKILRNS
jgi:N-acetylglucosaminyldiphosphoundecaprenol N-acetyl-beta-D-mannosaminyltransferase